MAGGQRVRVAQVPQRGITAHRRPQDADVAVGAGGEAGRRPSGEGAVVRGGCVASGGVNRPNRHHAVGVVPQQEHGAVGSLRDRPGGPASDGGVGMGGGDRGWVGQIPQREGAIRIVPEDMCRQRDWRRNRRRHWGRNRRRHWGRNRRRHWGRHWGRNWGRNRRRHWRRHWRRNRRRDWGSGRGEDEEGAGPIRSALICRSYPLTVRR